MIDKSRSRAPNRPFYPVDPSATFEEGMVAALTQGTTATQATLASSGDVPLGIFWNSKTTLFVKTQVAESVSFASGNAQTLQFSLLVSGSVYVTNAAGTTVYTEGTDYSINTTNGVITRIAGGAIAAGGTVVVTYRYTVQQSDLQFYGVGYDRIPDDTLGSGSCTVVQGWCQLWIDIFDTQTNYNLDDSLGADANGVITNVSPSKVFAKVISVPTASDPWLGLETTTAVS